jgi:hypothetical protein
VGRFVVLSLVVVAALASPSPAAAHDLTASGIAASSDDPHGDPRAALPDTLVTQPVAQAEMGALAPQTFAAAGPNLPETWCGDETTANNTANQTVPASTAHFKLIYAHASDQPNRFGDLPARTDDQFSNRLQATVSLLGRYIAAQSGERKAPRWDMGSSCATNPGQYVDIQVVHLPKTLAQYNADVNNTRFELLDVDVRAAIGAGVRGPASGPRNLVIYADGFFVAGPGGSGIGGQGSMYTSAAADTPGYAGHNAGGLTSAVYGPATPPANGYAWPAPMLHEMTHNMGAVQLSAPHTSGAGHCDDRYDVMCYPDSGPSYVETTPCPRGSGAVDETYDCNGDDYFNPAPAAGNYLADHWNVYNSAHLGACSESYVACGVAPPSDATKPANTTPAAGDAWRTSAYSVTLTGSDSESAVDAWEWQVDAGTVNTTQVATVAGDGIHTLNTHVRDAVGNWSDWRAETVRVDGARPTAAHGCPPEWRSTAASCALTGADGTSGVARLEYQVGTGPIQTVTGASGSVPVSAAGETAVRVRAVDVAGNVTEAWDTGTVRIDPGAPAAGLDCPAAWQAAGTACRIVPGAEPPSGVAERRVRVGSTGDGVAWDDAEGVPFEGAVEVSARIRNGAGTWSDWSAPVSSKVDLTAPTVGIACSTIADGRHRCTPSASDAQSGLADARLVRNGAVGAAVRDGQPFVIAGPASVAVTAVDAVGREATSRTLTLAGRATTPGGTPGEAESTVTRTAAVRKGRRSVGTGTLELTAGPTGRRLVAGLGAKLPRGTWRLRICVTNGKCAQKTVKLRRRADGALRVSMAAPPGEVRATFTVLRKVGRRFRPFAEGATSAKVTATS